MGVVGEVGHLGWVRGVRGSVALSGLCVVLLGLVSRGFRWSPAGYGRGARWGGGGARGELRGGRAGAAAAANLGRGGFGRGGSRRTRSHGDTLACSRFSPGLPARSYFGFYLRYFVSSGSRAFFQTS